MTPSSVSGAHPLSHDTAVLCVNRRHRGPRIALKFAAERRRPREFTVGLREKNSGGSVRYKEGKIVLEYRVLRVSRQQEAS